MYKFKAEVLKYGAEARHIFSKQCLITFKDPVPKDLEPYCVILEELQYHDVVKSGDIVYLGNESFEITAVGDQVDQSLKELGHASIYFDQAKEPLLPGCIHVSGLLNKDIDFESMIIAEKSD